jgi:hypothetical protein
MGVGLSKTPFGSQAVFKEAERSACRFRNSGKLRLRLWLRQEKHSRLKPKGAHNCQTPGEEEFLDEDGLSSQLEQALGI